MTTVPEGCRLSEFCLQWLFPHSWYLLQRYSLSVYFCTEKTSLSHRRDVYLNISMFTQKDCPHNGGHIHVIHPILFSLYQLLQSHCTLVCTGMIHHLAIKCILHQASSLAVLDLVPHKKCRILLINQQVRQLQRIIFFLSTWLNLYHSGTCFLHIQI